jgi:hypothetical protein
VWRQKRFRDMFRGDYKVWTNCIHSRTTSDSLFKWVVHLDISKSVLLLELIRTFSRCDGLPLVKDVWRHTRLAVALPVLMGEWMGSAVILERRPTKANSAPQTSCGQLVGNITHSLDFLFARKARVSDRQSNQNSSWTVRISFGTWASVQTIRWMKEKEAR